MTKKYSLKTANCMNGYFAITDSFQFIFSDNLFLLKSLINISLIVIMVVITPWASQGLDGFEHSRRVPFC